ncbi:hypothetical protein D4764_18G0000990 [Takifugu flavidus]|uniref:Uncharacterized protein n=1 Tax=Takifugu flavidus TaxID=433684 RepID=A0A5C6NPY4_9TELE|nr:hypothetical protein D4764_18G0000990 [Takifugu flavidus]
MLLADDEELTEGLRQESASKRLGAHTKSMGFKLGDWVELSQNAEPRGRTRTLGTVLFRVQQAGVTERGLQETGDEQQRSQDQAEKSGPGEQTGTRNAEAEVVVRDRRLVCLPGDRRCRQVRGKQVQQQEVRQGDPPADGRLGKERGEGGGQVEDRIGRRGEERRGEERRGEERGRGEERERGEKQKNYTRISITSLLDEERKGEERRGNHDPVE